jgi:hypothetical protein
LPATLSRHRAISSYAQLIPYADYFSAPIDDYADFTFFAMRRPVYAAAIV